MNDTFSKLRTKWQQVVSAVSPVTRAILLMAVWFGLVAGLIEGIGLWGCQELGWLHGTITFLGSSIEIVWIAALFDLILFGLVGLALLLLARLWPRLPALRVAAFLFAFLAFFDWLAVLLLGHIHLYAILLLAIGLAIEATRWFGRYQAAAMHFWRRSVPWLVTVAVLALVGIQGGAWLWERLAMASLPPAAPDSPNILVIVVDTLRADHLSSYGYARPTSPNIDRLAQQGVLFENAFAASSWTKPSHASLVTGRYVHEHGADAMQPLDGRYLTIAEALRSRGYRTGAFAANNSIFNRREGFGRGFIHFEDHYQSMGDILVGTVYGRVIETYFFHDILGFQGEINRIRAVNISSSTVRWIEQDPTKPFFAFLNYYDSHAPYDPPQPYRSKFSQLVSPGGLINTNWDMEHIYVALTPEQLQEEIDAYDGAIAYVDDHIGRLLADLQRRDLADNTLVIITADHGELFGEHGLMEHQNSLYREVIHVPLIFWWPGHLPASERVTQPVTNAALPATLLDLLGETGQAEFPGPALTRLWREPGPHPDWPSPLAEIAQIPWVPSQHLTAHGAMKSVLSPQWQYIIHEKFGEELYDWRNDARETNNLAKNPKFHSVLNDFRLHLEILVADITHWFN